MKDTFSNSDARNSDFEKSELKNDYTVTAVSEGKLGKYDVYIMDLKANDNEVTYPFMKMWVSKNGTLILKTEDYSKTERLMRTSLYPSYTKVSGKFMPIKMIFIDELIEGSKTQIQISKLSTKELPDNIFTKEYVERVNR